MRARQGTGSCRTPSSARAVQKDPTLGKPGLFMRGHPCQPSAHGQRGPVVLATSAIRLNKAAALLQSVRDLVEPLLEWPARGVVRNEFRFTR